jgi:hypothetical protein
MNSIVVALVYGAALILALALLYFFRVGWYWHVLSAAAALGLGFTPLPSQWGIPDLLVGFIFLLLLVWGGGSPLVRTHHVHLPHHA